MALSVKHAFTSAKSDGADATLVRPSNWNAEHTLTAAVDKVLGTNSGSTTVTELACTAFGRSQIAAADMAAWLTATALQATSLTWSVSQTFGAAIVWNGAITPTALAADTNDWAPTNFNLCNQVRASASTHVNLTGLAGGAAGRVVVIHNVGSNVITMKAQSASSSGANRFSMPSDIALRQHDSVTLIYDTSSVWKVIGGNPKAIAPTMQVLNSGSSATYTKPAGCSRIRVRAIGGGGAAGGGTAGGNTSFNSIVAAGGSPGGASSGSNPGTSGAGGTGGSGSADLRIPGGSGGRGVGNGTGVGTIVAPGGVGGSGMLGGGPGPDTAAGTNTGCGGAAITVSATNGSASSGGGGAGEYFELTIGSPAATYTYTVGAGGVGSGTTSGAAGRIIVEEFYD